MSSATEPKRAAVAESIGARIRVPDGYVLVSCTSVPISIPSASPYVRSTRAAPLVRTTPSSTPRAGTG